MKLCKDCKYYHLVDYTEWVAVSGTRNYRQGTWHKCRVYAKEMQDFITGDIYYIDDEDCYEMRTSGECGQDAKLWESKRNPFGLEHKTK